jgi:hypothetical protein
MSRSQKKKMLKRKVTFPLSKNKTNGNYLVLPLAKTASLTTSVRLVTAVKWREREKKTSFNDLPK